MAISNATRLADFGTGIGTAGAVIDIDNTNQRVGLGTTNPNATVTVGPIGAAGTSFFVHGDARVLGVLTATTFSGSGSELTGLPGQIDLWSKTAAGINTLGSVGIGTTNPVADLTVGPVGTSGTSLFVHGDGRITGVLTATAFYGDGQYLLNSGINTTSNVGFGTTRPDSIARVNNTTILNAGIVTAYELYGDGSNLTGISQVGGASSVSFNDGVGAFWGAGQDLQIDSDGTQGVIAGDSIYVTAVNGNYIAKLHATNSQEFYFNNSKKLDVNNTGCSITGSLVPSGGIYLGGAGGGNYLNDYETGTWTPTINSGYTITYGSERFGEYIKIGQLVYVQGYMKIDALSGSSSDAYARIFGLPFTTDSTEISNGGTISWFSGLAGEIQFSYFDDNNTYITLLGSTTSGSRDHVGPGDVWAVNGKMAITGCYQTD